VLQSFASTMSDTFTAEQVAEHNTRDDIWFAIHGKVYDVTGFLDEHPGGEEVCNSDN
jgi:cytochrome b involved in lipid metabolism